ncbi:MAG: iron-sulfur cluster assembly accessory protein, partial [Candidatus Calescibacterium sp.]|nr:iron-sulfur cluster assembly accessory protein [Candidatus Calescibacterium sp.]
MLSLTEKAKEKIKEMITEENGNYYLRVYAMPAGCCGLEFGMELTNEIDSSDNFLDFNDFKVVVDDFSFPFVENLQI